MAKYSKAQARATKKYFEKNDLVKMEIRVSRTERERIKEQARECGYESFSAYLLNLVRTDPTNILLTVPDGWKETIKVIAEAKGLSLQDYIIDCVEAQSSKDVLKCHV